MQDFIPPQPKNSFRIILDLLQSESRLDNVLLSAVKQQEQNLKLKEISRVKFKELFKAGKVYIKGQKAKPNSGVNKGITYVDILGN